jgi:hypothetical protein
MKDRITFAIPIAASAKISPKNPDALRFERLYVGARFRGLTRPCARFSIRRCFCSWFGRFTIPSVAVATRRWQGLQVPDLDGINL